MDADAGNSGRRIMAFVGGLDLCDGRYDTPGHPIFSTLQTVHKDDYHQPNYTVSISRIFLLIFNFNHRVDIRRLEEKGCAEISL